MVFEYQINIKYLHDFQLEILSLFEVFFRSMDEVFRVYRLYCCGVCKALSSRKANNFKIPKNPIHDIRNHQFNFYNYTIQRQNFHLTNYR